MKQRHKRYRSGVATQPGPRNGIINLRRFKKMVQAAPMMSLRRVLPVRFQMTFLFSICWRRSSIKSLYAVLGASIPDFNAYYTASVSASALTKGTLHSVCICITPRLREVVRKITPLHYSNPQKLFEWPSGHTSVPVIPPVSSETTIDHGSLA